MTVDLLTPILEGGIEHNHFFEGRLLTGRDLRDEQEGNRRNRWQLGRAVGAGVVHGLEVSHGVDAESGDPVLTVKAGLAFNRKGQPLELHRRIHLALLDSIGEVPEDAGVFRGCSKAVDTLVASGIGLYVLVASPASGFRESAPKSGLGTGGKVAGCGKRYEVEGVRFRLERLDPSEVSGLSEETRREMTSLLSTESTKGRSRLRNLTAHLCFGSERLAGLTVDPLAQVTGGDFAFRARGALDDLLAAGALTPCDIPLAVLQWTFAGVGFVDLWSVRRRPRPEAPSHRWPVLTGEGTTELGEAGFLQFQQQLDELLASHRRPATVAARDHFRYLPAAAVLPLAGPGRRRGLSASRFLRGKRLRGPIHIEGSQLRALTRLSLEYPPIDLSAEEMVWLYLVRENRQPTSPGDGPPAAPYAVVTSPYMPFFGASRYDVSHWNFANFTSLL